MAFRLSLVCLLLAPLVAFSQLEFSLTMPGGRTVTHLTESPTFEMQLSYMFPGSNLWTIDNGLLRLTPDGQYVSNRLIIDSDSSFLYNPNVCTDPFGNTYMTSQVFGGNDRLVCKIDTGNAVEWQRSLKSSGMQYGSVSRMMADSNALYVVGHNRQNNGHGVYFQKLSHSGQLLVSKLIAPVVSFTQNAFPITQPRILKLQNGNLLIFFQHIDGGGDQIFFLSETDVNGNVQWAKHVDVGVTAADIDVMVLDNGDILCLGARIPNLAQANDQSVVMMKFSSSGNLLALKNIEPSLSSAGMVANAFKLEGDTLMVIGTYWPTPNSQYPQRFHCKADTGLNIHEVLISADTAEIICATAFSDNTLVTYSRGFTNGVFGAKLNRFLDHSTACNSSWSAIAWQEPTISHTVSNVSFSSNTGAITTQNRSTTTPVLGIATPSCYNCTSPVAAFSASGVSGISFSNASTGAGGYLWDFGDGTTSTAANPTHQFPTTGTFTVTLTAQNGCGTDVAVQQVTFDPPPISYFGFQPLTQGVQFTDSASYADTNFHFWTFGDGNSSGLANPSHIYASSGTYSVCLAVSNAVGTDTFCQNITITCPENLNPFSFAEGSNDTMLFTSNSSGVLSSQWLIDDSLVGSGDVLDYIFHDTGFYDVCQVLTNACGVDTLCQMVQGLCSEVSVQFTYSIMGDTVVFSGMATHADTLWWDFGNGNLDTALSPTHTYANPGPYLVQLTGQNHCSQRTVLDTITIAEEVGVQAFAAETIRVYARGYTLHVQASSAAWVGANIQVHDLSGRLLAASKVAEMNFTLPLSGLAPQVVLVRVVKGSEAMVVKVPMTK